MANERRDLGLVSSLIPSFHPDSIPQSRNKVRNFHYFCHSHSLLCFSICVGWMDIPVVGAVGSILIGWRMFDWSLSLPHSLQSSILSLMRKGKGRCAEC